MRRLLVILVSLLITIIGFVGNQALAGKPRILKACTNCHKSEPNRVRGKLVNYSPKFSSVHVNVGPLVWIIKYDENTMLEGTDSLKKVKKGKEMSVIFTGDEDSPLATKISIKKPFKLPDEKLVSLDEMKNLVLKGPDKGEYVLVDSRPPGAYNSGHLPGAVSLPFPKLKIMKEKALPSDKNSRVIFYCGGFAWALSPSSARVAEEIGYRNIKVFHAGLPAWKESAGLVVSEPAYVMDMMNKDASYVLLDLRSTKEAETGHIKGAVSVPTESMKAKKQNFPDDKSAPIILYADKTANKEAFKIVREWGYKNVSVMNGGMEGWQKAKGEVVAGGLATGIVYVKKIPKNEIGIDEFKTIVEKQPSDKIVLDVRGADTIAKGAINGSMGIPLDDLETRLADLPKDKEIIIHCNTGIMASMAQKKLDKKGYRSRILNAVVQVASDGSYEVSEK